jgi:nucleoside-diphosphate-sugar epimerase
VKIVVTGASRNSFLGWHVRKAFAPYKAAGPEDKFKHYIIYTGSEYNLVECSHTRQLFIDHQPDVVVHMAAKCGGILANKNSPADFLSDNTYMSLNMYAVAREMQLKRMYTLGSVCSYPKHCPVPFQEDDLFNGYPEETNAPYGQSKRTLLMLGQTYREQYDIGGAHLIPVNMYGENDHFDLTNSHVIPALINKFINAKENDLPSVPVWGTGDATREFLYAGDCAEAIVKAVMTGLDTPDPINIGTGKDISIKDLAYLLRQIIEYTGEIVFTGEVSDGQPERRLDVSRAKDVLGFEAQTDLEDGLKKTIAWYMKNRG